MEESELRQFHGVWIGVTRKLGNRETLVPGNSRTFIIAGNKFYGVVNSGLVHPTTIRVDATKRPKSIQITMEDGDRKGQSDIGIYELTGDRLRICFLLEKERGIDFDAAERGVDGVLYWELLRERSSWRGSTMPSYVRQTIDGDRVSFSFAWWLLAAILGSGVVFFPIGLWIRKRMPRFGWALAIGCPVLSFILAAAFCMPRVNLSSDGVNAHLGPWGIIENEEIDFKDVKIVRIADEKESRDNSKVDQALVFYFTRAVPLHFPLDDTLKIAAADAILEKAAEKGIMVVGK